MGLEPSRAWRWSRIGEVGGRPEAADTQGGQGRPELGGPPVRRSLGTLATCPMELYRPQQHFG